MCLNFSKEAISVIPAFSKKLICILHCNMRDRRRLYLLVHTQKSPVGYLSCSASITTAVWARTAIQMSRMRRQRCQRNSQSWFVFWQNFQILWKKLRVLRICSIIYNKKLAVWRQVDASLATLPEEVLWKETRLRLWRSIQPCCFSLPSQVSFSACFLAWRRGGESHGTAGMKSPGRRKRKKQA